jgi:hypothetical protein
MLLCTSGVRTPVKLLMCVSDIYHRVIFSPAIRILSVATTPSVCSYSPVDGTNSDYVTLTSITKSLNNYIRNVRGLFVQADHSVRGVCRIVGVLYPSFLVLFNIWRLLSCGKLRCLVYCKFADISEELTVSIFRVEEQAKEPISNKYIYRKIFSANFYQSKRRRRSIDTDVMTSEPTVLQYGLFVRIH